MEMERHTLVISDHNSMFNMNGIIVIKSKVKQTSILFCQKVNILKTLVIQKWEIHDEEIQQYSDIWERVG